MSAFYHQSLDVGILKQRTDDFTWNVKIPDSGGIREFFSDLKKKRLESERNTVEDFVPMESYSIPFDELNAHVYMGHRNFGSMLNRNAELREKLKKAFRQHKAGRYAKQTTAEPVPFEYYDEDMGGRSRKEPRYLWGYYPRGEKDIEKFFVNIKRAQRGKKDTVLYKTRMKTYFLGRWIPMNPKNVSGSLTLNWIGWDSLRRVGKKISDECQYYVRNTPTEERFKEVEKLLENRFDGNLLLENVTRGVVKELAGLVFYIIRKGKKSDPLPFYVSENLFFLQIGNCCILNLYVMRVIN